MDYKNDAYEEQVASCKQRLERLRALSERLRAPRAPIRTPIRKISTGHGQGVSRGIPSYLIPLNPSCLVWGGSRTRPNLASTHTTFCSLE